MKKTNLMLLAGLILSVSACFEYNPNQIILDDDEKDLTAKNLSQIQSTEPSDTFQLIFMGDTQRFYDQSADFVDVANTIPDISFVVHGGDISDFGLVTEYRWVHDIMSDLQRPYLTVVGNHDLLANGKKVYAEMYGELNYSFEYGGHKFIFLNTNSREYDFNGKVPDLNWLDAEIEDNPNDLDVVVISHVPPFDADFDPNLVKPYTQLLASKPKVKLSLHAHTHSFLDEKYYEDGVEYFVTTAMIKRGFAVIKLWNGGYDIKKIEY
ncbi:metallophosphoesterase family protein [Fulvivirga ligni]|uniref:metallophosphoesterase family protein n=1 Tax=Fulvivirga ligni TaxID=2904246 RepID=UPI001F43AEA1|nr:metallophosphoesterase [Fulvivirga ligni]UII19363.1 metallophosphoesterase [Fulvivirga ligni]